MIMMMMMVVMMMIYCTCWMSFPKDLNSGLAGILRGVPVKTSCPDEPSAANRSQKNTLSYSIDDREEMKINSIQFNGWVGSWVYGLMMT